MTRRYRMSAAERIVEAALHVIAIAGGAAFYIGAWVMWSDLIAIMAR